MNRRLKKAGIGPFLVLLALCAIIAVKSWWPDSNTQQKGPPGTAGMYVAQMIRTTAALEKFATTDSPLMIDAEKKLKPVKLAQAHPDLLFALADANPEKTSAFIDKVSAETAQWSAAGNKIADVYLDYTAEELDSVALETLTRDLRKELKKRYALGLFVRRAWLEKNPQARNDLANIGKNVRTYVFTLSESTRPGEDMFQTLAWIDKLELLFILRVPNEAAATALKNNPQPLSFFVGMLIDAAVEK